MKTVEVLIKELQKYDPKLPLHLKVELEQGRGSTVSDEVDILLFEKDEDFEYYKSDEDESVKVGECLVLKLSGEQTYYD